MVRKILISITLFLLLLLSGGASAAPLPPAKAAVHPGVYSIDYDPPRDLLDPSLFPVDGQLGFWLWSDLNPQQGLYDWSPGAPGRLQTWMDSHRALGLRSALMLSTYDASTANDIRSTPNWVIKLPGATLPVTLTNGLPHYIDYYHRKRARHQNGEFDSGVEWWTISNANAITVTKTAPADSHVSETPDRPDRPSKGPALKLGGANGINATIAHDPEPIPAMPPELNGRRNAYISARVNIVTSDPSPNDRLYMEVWDEAGMKLGGTEVTVANTAHAGKPASYWGVYELDITPFALEQNARVAFRVVTDGANPTTFYVDNVQLRVRHLIPKYWTDPYLKAYKEFIAALGRRWKQADAAGYDLEFIAMGTGVYGESQPTQDVNEWEYGTSFDHVVKQAGLDTTGEWQGFINAVTEAHAAAFAAADGSGPTRPILLQYAPYFLDPQERGITTDFAAARGIGASHNRLIPEWTQVYKNNLTGAYDPIRKYWQSVPTAFEGSESDLICSPVLTYWSVVGAVARHTDYLRVDPALIRGADGLPNSHAGVFEWARQYLGKAASDTPAAWTIMREQRNPFMLRCGSIFYATPDGVTPWAEYGNFNFYLMQDDTIAGGRTVAETNDKGADRRYARDPATGAAWTEAGMGNCPTKGYSDIYDANPPTCNPQPYNPLLPALAGQDGSNYKDFYNPWDWTGGGVEAYVVRRTDNATGNPFMFFRADDGYIAPARAGKAQFTVGYFDIGTDAWTLRYQSATGEKAAGTVTKTGTGAYREVTFTVSDARLANGLRGGADFYLDSRGDGDEWLHLMEVRRIDPELTETPSPTPTATATATETPTATPTVTATADVERVYLPLLVQ